MFGYLLLFEKRVFSQVVNFFYFFCFRFNFGVVFHYMRRDPWLWIHVPMSFMYVTCIWVHMYIWYAEMSLAYFVSCADEFPLLWDIFTCIILPYYFPNWFDFYEVPGVENIFIESYPDKELKKKP
jgi:hypothetical protein